VADFRQRWLFQKEDESGRPKADDTAIVAAPPSTGGRNPQGIVTKNKRKLPARGGGSPAPTYGGGGGATIGRIDQRAGQGYREADTVYDVEAGVIGIAPRYRNGDELIPLKLGTEFVASANILMMRAGLLGKDTATGVWLDKSVNAFKQVLAYANRTGLTWQGALEEMAGAGDASGLNDTGSGRAPFQARLSNPDDLKEVVKQTAFNVLGGKGFVDEDQLNEIVSSFQEKELTFQKRAHGGGGVIEEPPSLDTAALAQLKETDPDGYQAAQFSRYGKLLEGLIGGVSG